MKTRTIIKVATIEEIYVHPNDFYRAIDHLRSQFQAKEIIPLGKEISVRNLRTNGQNRKKIIAYEKKSKTEFMLIVNLYYKINKINKINK